MITLLNMFIGTLVRVTAFCAVRLLPVLKIELSILRNKTNILLQKKMMIPEMLFNTVVSVEDKRFFHHRGVDCYAIVRALRNNIFKSRFEGASTIGQQLVRNITDYREITLKRKMKEILFSVLIDHRFTKQEILLAYFNSYRFGERLGVAKFCIDEQYPLYHLSEIESAQIAARFKYPSLTINNYIKYLKRVRKIEILISRKKKNINPAFRNNFHNKESINSGAFPLSVLNPATNEVI